MSEQDRRTFIKVAATSAAAIALSRLATPQPTAAATRGSFVTSDGYTLRYDEAGSGQPLVCVPGWSQTAAQWKHQVSGLSDRFRVIAVDMRGHGESDKPTHGYTIQRLAKDVQDLITALNLKDVTVMGHSMGCSVMWSYWELWGPDRISRLALIDQMPMITANPAWVLGIDSIVGTLEPGKMADVVVWSADPFSVYARALQVYNDGWLVYDRNDPARQLRTDFELGQVPAPGGVR